MRKYTYASICLALVAGLCALALAGCPAADITGVGAVNLGGAGDFVILAKTAITNVPTSTIKGDIGLSPYAESFLSGFAHTDATGYATSEQVTGKIYASDMAVPTPAMLTAAVADMEAAYTDAAGRDADFNDLGAGSIGGLTLAPGVYKWGSSVVIPTDVTLLGTVFDTWIFQVSGDLSIASGAKVLRSGGAMAANIFWQVAGTTILGSTSNFEGVILCQTEITLNTGAELHGKALAQSMVALDQNVVTDPTW